MLGALIGCGLAAVGGAAIGSYIGTARGIETGLRMQKERLEASKKLELEKQPEYERMVEEARKKALEDKDSYYGRAHQLELLAIDFRWWSNCLYFVETSRRVETLRRDAVGEVALVLHGILSKAVSLVGDETRVVYFFQRKGCHDVEFIMNVVHAKCGPFTGDSRRMRGADLVRYE